MSSPTPTTELAQSLPRVDVRCFAGRPLTITVSVVMDGDPMPAAAIESARAHVRQGVDDPTVLHQFSSTDDPATVAVGDGELTITADSATTTAWADLWPGSAPETSVWWDVEIIDSDGEPWQITAPGVFVVVHQVTR